MDFFRDFFLVEKSPKNRPKISKIERNHPKIAQKSEKSSKITCLTWCVIYGRMRCIVHVSIPSKAASSTHPRPPQTEADL